MSQTKVKSGLISDQSITASKLDVTGNGNSGEVLASAGDGSFVWTSGIATEAYTDNAISNIIDGAPGALDTLNELAAALGDDANFASTVTTALGTKVDGTGTTNYISKWSDSNTLGSSVIYDNGTNVGIGTSSPAYKLDVNGIINIPYSGTNSNYFGTNFAFGYGRMYPFNASGLFSFDTNYTSGGGYQFNYNGTERMRIDSSGNVGIGTSSPSQKLTLQNGTFQITGTSTFAGNVEIGRVGSDDNMAFATGGTERMRIDSSGNVGIGTTSPNNTGGFTTLTLNNATSGSIIDFETNGTLAGRLFNTSSSFNVFTQVAGHLSFGTGGVEKMRITSSGNVGIGTSSPTQFVQIGSYFQAKKLHVAGSYNFGGVYIGAVNSNTGSTIEFVSHTGVTTSRSFRVGSNTDLYGSDKLVFEISNSTTTYGGLSYSPKMLLNSLGNLHVDGDVIAYSTTVSDERLKDNIVTIDNALNKVCELRGVEYDWNASSRSGQHDMGVIAQEVEKVFPFIVREKEMALVDGNTYKTVDYEKLVGVLIEAVKELKQEIEILKSK